MPRRDALRAALATALLFAGAGSVKDATAVGETRTLSFHHSHSGEDLTVTFKRSGRYDQDSLKKLNHFLRDWRSQDSTAMDPHLFDILWEVYRDVDAKQPIQIISAYRSPKTNSMLRRRSKHSGVARHSQHMLGHAMDFFIPGVPLEQIRFAGLRLQRGGVGFYPTSGSPFVHLDTGNVRHWPRMTHDQLVRVFPNGRTVHIPTDGKPLAGYDLAMADIERRKTGEGSGKPGLLASLFGRKQQPAAAEDDDEAGSDTGKPGVIARATETIKDKAEAIGETIAAAVPLPRAKPAMLASKALDSKTPDSRAVVSAQPAPYQVASAADITPLPSARPQADTVRPLTPADIINSRAFWNNSIAMPKLASPEQVAALRARKAVTEADPLSTSSLPTEVAQALAFAPAHERPQIVAASAPMPMTPRQRLAATHAAVETMVAKSRAGQPSAIATVAQVAAASQMNHLWTKAMMMTPNVTTSLSSTHWVERDMTKLAVYFVKPARVVAMTFNDDVETGPATVRFTGTAITPLPTAAFPQRTAALR